MKCKVKLVIVYSSIDVKRIALFILLILMFSLQCDLKALERFISLLHVVSAQKLLRTKVFLDLDC